VNAVWANVLLVPGRWDGAGIWRERKIAAENFKASDILAAAPRGEIGMALIRAGLAD
jgi:hypothetical protein